MVSYEDICLDDIDYSDLEKQYAVELDLSTDHIMIVDQIPKLDDSKEDKFILIFRKKILGDLSATVKPSGIYIPKDPETNMGKGQVGPLDDVSTFILCHIMPCHIVSCRYILYRVFLVSCLSSLRALMP